MAPKKATHIVRATSCSLSPALSNQQTAELYHFRLNAAEKMEKLQNIFETLAAKENTTVPTTSDIFAEIRSILGLTLPIVPYLEAVIRMANEIKSKGKASVVGTLRILQCPVELSWGTQDATATGRTLKELDIAAQEYAGIDSSQVFDFGQCFQLCTEVNDNLSKLHRMSPFLSSRSSTGHSLSCRLWGGLCL